MLEFKIPGLSTFGLSYLVLDYNGTIACDGQLIPGVNERLESLAKSLEIHVLTADTFGTVWKALSGIPCRLEVIPVKSQAEAKLRHAEKLGLEKCICIGNGRNDILMLKQASLGIAVVQMEGASVEAILGADIITSSILDALDLLLHPLRLTATLRS